MARQNLPMSGETQETATAPISGLVPMSRVRDVARSAKFYEHLGFAIGNYFPREEPTMSWAWLYQPKAQNWKTDANLMLVRGEGGFDSNPDTHVVLSL